jgi:hypothetical protein
MVILEPEEIYVAHRFFHDAFYIATEIRTSSRQAGECASIVMNCNPSNIKCALNKFSIEIGREKLEYNSHGLRHRFTPSSKMAPFSSN